MRSSHCHIPQSVKSGRNVKFDSVISIGGYRLFASLTRGNFLLMTTFVVDIATVARYINILFNEKEKDDFFNFLLISNDPNILLKMFF